MDTRTIIIKVINTIVKLIDSSIIVVDTKKNKKPLINGYSKNSRKSVTLRKIDKIGK